MNDLSRFVVGVLDEVEFEHVDDSGKRYRILLAAIGGVITFAVLAVAVQPVRERFGGYISLLKQRIQPSVGRKSRRCRTRSPQSTLQTQIPFGESQPN